MRSPLTEKFLRIVALRDEVKTWPQDEQDFFLDMLAPEPETKSIKKPAKQERKIEHCEVCDYTRRAAVHKDSSLKDYHEFQSSAGKPKKSPRAQSLSGVIQRTPKVRASDDNEDDNRCTYKLGEDARGRPVVCDRTLDNNVHHKKTDPDYHEFITTARADDYGDDAGKSPAPGVAHPSSTNGGTGNGTASSGTQPEDVSGVHREASGGD